MSSIQHWIKLIEGERVQIRDVIRSELAKTGFSPRKVNDGYCGHLADKVVATLGRGQVLTTDDTPVDAPGGRHEWVFVDGKHYDAETVNGVTNPINLGYFRRHIRQQRT